MGQFYFSFVNVSLNSSCLDSFWLFYTDNDIKCKAVEIHTVKNNSQYREPSSDVEIIDSRTGVIEDYGNDMCFLYNDGKSYVVSQSSFLLAPTKRLTLCMDGYAVSLFLFCLHNSQKYVELVTKHMSHNWSNLCKQHDANVQVSKLLIKLKPQRHVMDLLWARMACKTIHELRQLQYAMSWLSTLGGAFSALGEQQERCAKAAGVISIEQLRIALKLGDKIVITQCKLYFSLSLIQRGYCKLAKKLILEQYCNLKNSIVVDRKTLNMCKGIWARLKYELQKQSKLNKSMPKQGSCKPIRSQGKVRVSEVA